MFNFRKKGICPFWPTSSIDQFPKRKPSAWASYDIMILQNSHHLVMHNYNTSFYSGSLPPIFHGKNYQHINPLPSLKHKTKPLYSINKHLWQCQQGRWDYDSLQFSGVKGRMGNSNFLVSWLFKLVKCRSVKEPLWMYSNQCICLKNIVVRLGEKRKKYK